MKEKRLVPASIQGVIKRHCWVLSASSHNVKLQGKLTWEALGRGF